MKNRLSIYSVIMILGSIVSLILIYMRHTGQIHITLMETLIPTFIPYVAMAGTLVFAFIYGAVCGVLDIDID